MKTTITETMFKEAFVQANRTDNFSYAGLSALFEYIEEYEESCEMSVELDVVALCCEYSEYESATKCIEDTRTDVLTNFFIDGVDSDDLEEECLEYLRDTTQVIEFDGGIIICDF